MMIEDYTNEMKTRCYIIHRSFPFVQPYFRPFTSQAQLLIELRPNFQAGPPDR